MAEDNTYPSYPVHQNHEGPGDNVGVKNVYHSIALSDLISPVEAILTSIRHRDTESAQSQLQTLLSASNLSPQANGLMDVLQIALDLALDQTPANAYGRVDSFLKTDPEGVFKDIALSVYIRLDIRSGNIADARNRYKEIGCPGSYLKEAFFEFAACENEIETSYLEKSHSLDEMELCGLIRGSIRNQNYDFSLQLSERLKHKYPSYNSYVLFEITSTYSLLALNPPPYWLTTPTVRDKLKSITGSVSKLIADKSGKDKRLINLACDLIGYVSRDCDELENACWQFISETEKASQNVAEYLSQKKDRVPKESQSIPGQLFKASRDHAYRQSTIGEITNRKAISIDDVLILSSMAESATIRSWIDDGGIVKSSDAFEESYSMLELLCFAHNGSGKSEEEIREALKEFVNQYACELPKLNTLRLYSLVERLLDAGITIEVCDLLKPHIPETDIWPSPIICSYLSALLASQQLTTLKFTLSQIPEEYWSDFIWQVQTNLLCLQNDFRGALKAINQAKSLNQESLEIWANVIFLHRKNGAGTAEIADVLNQIPDAILSNDSKMSGSILHEIALSGDFARVEKVLFPWFIKDPEGAAITISNFYLSLITRDDGEVPINFSKTMDDGSYGITCTIDGSQFTKIISFSESSNSGCIVSSSSPLGEAIHSINIGETTYVGMQEIRLTEKIPPLLAAYRIAVELRQAANDGTDCFHAFSVPDDPNEMMEVLTKKISAATNRTDYDLLSNPEIPIFMKGKRIGSFGPVQSAFDHLTSKECAKNPFPGVGEDRPSELILDIYSILYLGITGFADALINNGIKCFITHETQMLMENWLRTISRDDQMKVGVNQEGKLWTETADDVKGKTGFIKARVEKLLTAAEVLAPYPVDMPPELVLLQDSIDASVFSSMKLSVASNLPWFCVDEMFTQVFHNSGNRVVNVNPFLMAIGQDVPIEEKYQALILHSVSGLPYPLSLDELIQLCDSTEKHAHHFVANLLWMYPNAYKNTEIAVNYLFVIATKVLLKSYTDGEILNGLQINNPRNNGYAERVFNTCCYLSMQCDDDLEAEYKASLLIAKLLIAFDKLPKMSMLIKALSYRFVVGHFMSLSAVNSHLSILLSGDTERVN